MKEYEISNSLEAQKKKLLSPMAQSQGQPEIVIRHVRVVAERDRRILGHPFAGPAVLYLKPLQLCHFAFCALLSKQYYRKPNSRP